MFLHSLHVFYFKVINRLVVYFLTDAFTCTLPPKRGICEALTTRYFYNMTSEKCEQFTYGGCGGNKNNFISKKACEVRCNNTGEKI